MPTEAKPKYDPMPLVNKIREKLNKEREAKKK